MGAKRQANMHVPPGPPPVTYSFLEYLYQFQDISSQSKNLEIMFTFENKPPIKHRTPRNAGGEVVPRWSGIIA